MNRLNQEFKKYSNLSFDNGYFKFKIECILGYWVVKGNNINEVILIAKDNFNYYKKLGIYNKILEDVNE